MEKKKLLLVTGDVPLASSWKGLLESRGFAVALADSAEKALLLCKSKEKMDLVLLDVELGLDTTGLDAAGEILRMRDAPLVLIANGSDADSAEKLEKANAHGYVQKNTGIAVLKSTIKMALQQFQASRQAQDSDFGAIIDHQPGLVWLKDAEGRFRMVNQAFLESCGLTELSQIIGKTDLDVWPKVLAEKYRMDDAAVMQSGKPKLEEEPIRDKGNLTWHETFKSPVFDGQKRVIGTTGFSRDITKRMEATNKRQESENRYRALVELAIDGIILASHQGIITDSNDYICELVGMEKQRIIGSHFKDLPFIQESLEQSPLREDLLQNGKLVVEERILKRADGTRVIIEMRTKMMPDGCFQSLFHNITEQRQADEALRLKTTFLEAVANSSADGILVVDLRGQKILQNKRTLELWKIPDEVANDPDGRRQVAHILGVTKNPEKFMAEIQHQMQFPLEINKDELELVDGTVLDRYSAPVLGHDGQNHGRVYTFHDVTSFRQAEARIQRLLAEKEVILKEVHHRIKNNMGTLIGLLTLQAATLTDNTAIQALEDAQSRIQSMMVLYEKLYMSADFDSVSVASYLPALVDEIVANFPIRSIVKIDKRIEDFVLSAKSIQVVGILANELLTNIMKYAFAGRSSGLITIVATMSGKRVSLSIADNGNGIPDSIALGGSTGFGLMLVDLLIQQLNGTASIKRNNGTEFLLEFDA